MDTVKRAKVLTAFTRTAVMAIAFGGFGIGLVAQAQDAKPRHVIAAHPRAAGRVADRVLTVHRHAPRFVSLGRGPRFIERDYDEPALLRRWNDPHLYSFGGWRVGGDNFYGDTRGDPITRGNSTLGAISGYGPARGGYGGPHFDSVGGFHNAPGPDAQEDDDYASGSISTPDYGDVVPHYPSIKARVAALNTGVVPSFAQARFTRTSLRDTAPRVASPAEDDDATPFVRSDDLFPDIDIDAF